ncbi:MULTISPECIES: beta-glucosidase [unclassified Butyrivibrio]|uniref:beta-glucosidase n=1 Tax=unclassified Butyrivibrio TaxID=2639466 RepID=UPI0003FF65E1|nr:MULTISPECIES: glycoside hydrolase family 3 N-terminal domain-containing protein [unclassified Butyrivibrio]
MQKYEKEHRALVLKNAAECTVLLKNDGKFPIDKPCKLAAYGAGMRYTVMGGTGSGEVNTRFAYTIEQGLEKAGFEITTKKWLDEYDQVRKVAKNTFYKNLKKEAKEKHENVIMYAMGKEMTEPWHSIHIDKTGDTAIYVLSRNSGEGSDRGVVEGDVKLAASEVRDILALNKMYERFMLVLNVGGAVDLSPVMEVGNILLLSQLGTDCGRALADILIGKQNPSGKLTTTWASYEDYCHEGTFGDWNDTEYREGIYVGYRYFDTACKKPLFSFGYGLSYTSFEQKVLSVSASGDFITVSVNVKNDGDYSGKEVVQVYVSLPDGKLDKAYQELAGFSKTSLLEPGCEEQTDISFRLSDLSSYDEETSAYILEKGDYIIRCGNSSDNTNVVAVINLDETICVTKARNCLGDPGFKDLFMERHSNESIPEEVQKLTINSNDINCTELIYDVEEDVDERAKSLTDEELAYLAIGSFNEKQKGLSIIGNAATHVAGAAGETTSKLTGKGIKPLIMADGPAGLRLAKKYYEDENGAHDASGAGMIPDSMLEVMNPLVKFIALKVTGGKKAPKGAVIREHYATRIPIGTAIAQSFNTDLAYSFGDMVGSEMEEMGINLWLAPALNIHRSILCGRNFEYYSEDPLVSGLIAAAVTQGVQKHKGCGTTIKHYAANNAETNRYCNNSHVSERAMREIYLRGFEICVRKSQPKAVMTSYNLLNGTHTSEHRGLIQDILRSEFGFKGIVMTDWVMTVMDSKRSIYRNALSNEVAGAGGDLFMPGGKKDYENVLSAIKEGKLSRRQMEINASRVIRMVDEMLIS